MLAPKDIHADMVAILGDTALSCATVRRWTVHFKMARTASKMMTAVDDP